MDPSAWPSSAVSPYRAGYTPAERRKIETRLARGDLLAVVSTSALELGIDIGALDLCLLVGYPGTRIATHQRAGRVGRRQRTSAVILIAGEDALDAYFLKHPNQLWHGETERAVLNPHNPRILAQHLVCAAVERPLDTAETWLRLPAVTAVVDSLVAEGRLRRRADAAILLSIEKRPHRHVHLRTEGRPLPILDASDGHLIVEIDQLRAPRDTHPGALYLHRGTTYLIETLDLAAGKVTARPQRVGYTTRARTRGQTQIVSLEAEKETPGTTISFGKLQVEDQVIGYERIRRSDGRKLGMTDLDLPPQVFETEGLWFCVATSLLSELDRQGVDLMGALHAAEHLLIALFPLLVLADRNDVGGLSTNYHPQTDRATIFIYDGIPGGAGLCREAFGRFTALVRQAIATADTCQCDTGCPACVHSPKCGSGNEPLDKGGAQRLLEGLLNPTHFDSGKRLNLAAPPPGGAPSRGHPPCPTAFSTSKPSVRQRRSAVGGMPNAWASAAPCFTKARATPSASTGRMRSIGS
ncbi:MAG: DUF1998 domain-containing protein [Desulfosarcinaceae bacterium]